MFLLSIIAGGAGVLTAMAVRYTTNIRAMHETVNRLWAHLLEFRLYFDEPGLIWRAQMALIRDNARIVFLLLPSMLLLAVPMTWLFFRLEPVYGYKPLTPGSPAVVVARLNPTPGANDRLELTAPPWIAVETNPLHLEADHEIAWRIRPSRPGTAALTINVNGHPIRKAVEVGDASSLEDLLLNRQNEPNIQIDYPPAPKTWLLWFIGISTLSALLSSRWLPRRQSVTLKIR